MTNADFNDFMEKTRTLFLAVIDQALDDIRDYHIGANEVSYRDYVEALTYFHDGGEYDRWIELLELTDDRRFKWLKRCITSIPVPKKKLPPLVDRKPYVRTKKVAYTCKYCGKQGLSLATNRVCCPDCRKKANVKKTQRWRQNNGQHTVKRQVAA